ncbi:MAG: energy transducer TonB [Deltaproteobacteria bacterium]|nr:MAG: energy transducer TonB [Deltaproteobacteria bacterium]
MTRPSRHRRSRSASQRWLRFLGLSLLLHALLLAMVRPYWDRLFQVEPRPGAVTPITLIVDVPEQPVVEPPEPEPPDHGQIVEVPEPKVQERPEEADYLAEYDRTVPEETRTERIKVNPDVLSDTYSEESRLEYEDLVDLDVHEPSTGAQVGNDRFDPDRDGALASLPSPFALTNKDGLQKPVPASHREQALAGAPQNDLLDEEIGDRVALNSIEIKYADYINRIRRLVNFYWTQNLDNLPRSVRLAKPHYNTTVDVVLDGNGALESIVVTHDSGSEPIDNAVVDAFRIAGPFPNPPPQLIAPDGRVYLPSFGFDVEVGHARAPYMGVDPRQGVRYPGILKATR